MSTIPFQFLEVKQCRSSSTVPRGKRVGCRTGMVGSTILLCNSISQELLVFGCGSCMELISKPESHVVKGMSSHTPGHLQAVLFANPVNKLSGHLNDLMRDIPILRQMYHPCSLRGLGRRSLSPPVSLSSGSQPLWKGVQQHAEVCAESGQTGFLPQHFF